MQELIDVDNQWEKHTDAYSQIMDEDMEQTSLKYVIPRIIELCGEIENKKLLDYGCGEGIFSRFFL